MSADTNSLTGSWTHSYEEDGGDEQVYRPTHTFAFPLSRRGRATLEFGAAGQMIEGMPGPADGQSAAGALLTSVGMNRYRCDGGQTPGKIIEIIQSEPDLLKIRRL